MNTSKIKIYNGRVITPKGIIHGGSILLQEGNVVEISAEEIVADDAIALNARGKYISPGFIDIHVHGGGGHDFMDNSLTAFLEIAKTHAKYGTTALCPTTLSCEKEDLINTLHHYTCLNYGGRRP